MIIEGLAGFVIWVIELVFSLFQVISLPANLISVVIDILKFGAWVIGADLVLIVFTNIFVWLTFKFNAGLILWLYKLLPLT